jgi:hypothetical protein
MWPKRLATVIVGVAIAAVAAIAFFLYGVIGSWGCYGSDAGEGVQPGTLGDRLCGPPLWGPYFVCAFVAILAPILGATRGWRGVAAGFTASAGALTLVAILFNVAIGDTWTAELFVFAPLAAFVAGVLLTTRGRAHR